MKKSAKREEIKEKNKDNTVRNVILYMVIFVVVVALIWLFFMSLKVQPKEVSNGFIFQKQGNFWTVDVKSPRLMQVLTLEFRYAPSEVKNITVEGDPQQFFNILSLNQLDGAFFTINPTDNTSYMGLAAADISKLLNVMNGIVLNASCTENKTDACNNRPIVTCESQKDNAVVIYMKYSNETKISMKDNCLTIQGNGTDLIKAYTKLLFIWYRMI